MNEEFKKRIDTLSAEELKLYYRAARNTSAILDVLGVSTLFVMVTFTHFFIIAPGAILLYIFSNFSVGIGHTKKYIKERLELKINS